jgi:fumarate hydratase subunit alpha
VREIHVGRIQETVRDLCIRACCELPPDVLAALEDARRREESPLGRELLGQVLENAAVASRENMPLCQDTGLAVVFVVLGQGVRLVGGDLQGAVDEGVRRGYAEGYLRKSVVRDPIFARGNTGDNTPASVYVEVVPGDDLRIVVLPKGAGSENMGALKMLVPADGPDGIRKFVVETVERAGPNPCPPIIVGVGVGGMMERATLLAKKALLRTVGAPNPDPAVADLERAILSDINSLGIGPQGLGGRVTALAVHIETWPTHIAAMPVAVNLQCWAARHAEAVL